MSRYPNSVDRFVRKRNKRDSPQTIHDEAISISNGVGEAVLKHDNVNHNSIEIWTGEGKTGTEITSYLLETPSHMEWKTILRVFTNEPQVYVSYEFDGDQVEAEDVNELQSAIEATQTELDRHKENDPHADMRQSEYDTNYDGKVDRADRADVADSVEWRNVDGKPNEFPPGYHLHTEAEISDLDKYSKSEVDARLANKSDKGHVHTESDISDLDKYSKAEIDRMLQDKGEGDMLKSVYDKNDNGVVDEAESVPWTGVSGKPSEYPPEQHGHEMSEISGLQNELDGKMRAGPVTWGDLIGGGD